jgi:RHS repeat-associated protein
MNFQYISILIFSLLAVSLQGQNIPRANYTAPMGIQVNTYNGNLYLERTDVVIPNQDLPIGLSFSFNSFQDSTDTGYGYGWSHSYALRCLPYEGGVVVEREHGRRDSFHFENEQYVAPDGIFDQLTAFGGEVFELQDKYGMIYKFENPDHHYLTSVMNTNGSTLNLNYADSLLTSIVDASGRSLDLTYQDGHLASVVDNNYSGGRSWDFQYTSGNQLECVANPFGDCISYEYDEEGRMVKHIEERGFETIIRYDDVNRVSLLQTCIRKTLFAYNTEQFRTTVTEQNEGTDQITTFVYNEEGKLIQKTGNCCGYDMAYSYDNDNNLSEVTDANGNQRQATYDNLGNTITTRDAFSQQQQMSFGALSRLNSLTDKRGNATAFEYDEDGNLTRIIQPLGIETNFTYDGEGNMTSMEDGEGNATEIDYNSNNDIEEIRYEIGSEQYSYDAVGNLMSTTDANGNSVAMGYDALNRLRTITDDLGNQIQYNYDAASNLSEEIDPEQNIKSYEYDAHNRLYKVTTPIGETNYGYDALDNLTSITNAEGHASNFTYDTRSRLASETDAMGFTTRYEYDNNGNVIQRLDANMQVTNYRYDALNRLIQREYFGNTDNFEYDANGNLTKCSNNHISYAFTYDELNRLTSKTAENWGLTIRYEYDKAGNRTKMIDPNGGETAYVYDGNNRLVALTNPANETTEFIYDLGGRLTEQRNHNGTVTSYEYDVANRLLSLYNRTSNGTVLSSYEYTYNKNGLRTSMTDHTGGTATYEYDGENRLTRVEYTDGMVEEYAFDKAGNRTSLTKDGVATTYTYDAADRIQNAGTTSYDFDGNGNLIRKTDEDGVTEYHYDGENRLIHVTLPDGSAVNHQYDPFGSRISKNDEEETTHYFLDGDNVLLELDDDNNEVVRYTSALLMDSWISMQRDGQSYVYHKNALGSTTGMSNGSQVLVNEYTYDAYGSLKSITEGVENNYRYTGREWDEGIGLYYYRARYNCMSTGRFLTKDKILGYLFRPSSLNSYAYAEQNPIAFLDPKGNEIFTLIAIGFAAVTAVDLFNKTLENYIEYGDRWTCYEYSAFSFITLPIKYSLKPLKWLVGDRTAPIEKKLTGANNALKTKQRAYMDSGRNGGFKTEMVDEINHIKRNIDKLEKQKIIEQRNDGLVSSFDNLNNNSIGKLLDDAVDVSVSDITGEDCDHQSTGGSQEKSDPGESKGDSSNPGDDDDAPPTPPCDVCIPIIESFDPNEIVGPEGVGQQKWVKQESTLPYTILFENDPDFATAAAQRVVITHQFDDSVNPVSFRLGDFGFGDYYFQVPDDVSYYDTRIDLSDSLGIFLDVIASINQELGQAFWIFESIDPNTGLAETLPAELGFLPVNDTLTRAGEGFVNFTIRPSLLAETGDLIEAQASIVFDDNPAIETNIAINTIDGDAPESSLVAPIDTLDNGRYQLNWEGTDVGSGLADITLFASVSYGVFAPVTAPIIGFSSYTFEGEPDSVYRFFTIARDSVGNVEPMKFFGEPACMELLVDSVMSATAGQNDGMITIEVIGNVGPVTFEWAHDEMLDGPVAANLAGGEYQVIATDSLGCEISATIVVDVINQTQSLNTDLFIYQIFPVPAGELINVRFYTAEQLVSLTVVDVHGRSVIQQQQKVIAGQINEASINIATLAAGTYYLRLRTQSESVNGVFSKQ